MYNDVGLPSLTKSAVVSEVEGDTYVDAHGGATVRVNQLSDERI